MGSNSKAVASFPLWKAQAASLLVSAASRNELSFT